MVKNLLPLSSPSPRSSPSLDLVSVACSTMLSTASSFSSIGYSTVRVCGRVEGWVGELEERERESWCGFEWREERERDTR